MSTPLYHKGSWAEELESPQNPYSPLRIDYDRARRGFTKAIVLVYVVGFSGVIVVSAVLLVLDLSNWWRVIFNIVAYNVMAILLSLIVYRLALRTWLKGHAAGRVLSVSEISSDAVYSADANAVITTWSKGAKRMLEFTAEEVIGESVALILPDDFMDREAEMLEKLMEDGIVTRHLTYNKRKDGEIFPTEASITLLKKPDGSPAGFLTVLRDRTHQVQIEEELKHIRDEIQNRTVVGATARAVGSDVQIDEIWSSAEATVRALASVAERRDPYTAGHQRRVSQLATAIAREMDLPEDSIDCVRIAGILHDTGKVVIPAEILSRPSKLSEFEFEIVKTHPNVDYEIVEGIEFPSPIAKAVLQHHERLDGSGYPSGLKGEEIILPARILAVADVVEAMSSHRPYRPALGIDTALGEIFEGSGIRFDPEVVRACVRLFKEKEYDLD